MKKGLFLLLAILAMVLMLTVSVSAEEAVPVEEWQLVSSNMGTMTAYIFENSENGECRLEIVSVPTRPTSPITMPNNVNSNWAEYRDRITSVFVSEGTYTISSNAFADLTALKSVELSEGLVRIDGNAFANCKSLVEVRFPSTVTTANGGTFKNCTSLVSVELSEGLTSIGANMFQGCSALKSINISDKVTSIGNYAFSGCTSLGSVTIPSGVKSIGGFAFERCTSLTSVVIPEGVTQVGNNAFQNCTALTEFTLPSTLTSISGGMFRYCSSLTAVVIPDTVQVINASAFSDCTSLESITIGSGVTIIYGNAFTNCTLLTVVYIPQNVTRVEAYAFRSCKNIVFYVEAPEEEVLANWNSAWNSEKCTVYYNASGLHIHNYERTVTKEPTHFEAGVAELYCRECGDIQTETINKISHSYKSEVTKPATHFEAGVRTYSCECGYSYNVSISIIPHSYVSEITREATHLQAGIITYVCSCGASYTEEVPALTEHTYDSTVTKEATHYEAGIITYTCECGSYYTVEIPVIEHEFIDGVCSCGMVKGVDPIEIWDISYNTRELVTAYLYHDCENDGLYRLVISGNGRARYYNLPWKDYKNEISEVVFEDGVKYEVPGRAFESYPELRKVTIGNSIEVIRNGAFRLCEKLVCVEVTGTLKRIENSAFERCIALEEITGIAQLDYLGGYVFANCKSLRYFQAEFIKEVGARAFLQCENLEEFNVIGGVVYLRDAAFERCVKLCEVGSLEKLEYLGRYVFRDCLEIKKFILDAQFIELVPEIFANCRGLEVIIIRGDVKEIPRGAFNYCSNLKTVYIESSAPVVINDFAFQNCSNLKNVIVSGGVSYVGMRAFINCKALERVYFNSEIPVTVGERAFEGCSNLVSVVSSAGFADIGNNAFTGCQKLEKITLSKDTTTIGDSAFYGCRALKEIYIPDHIGYIGNQAFRECNNLTIYANIDINMFDGCNPLNRPVVPYYEYIPEEFYCEHTEVEHWVELERTHFNIGLEIYKCICGKVWGKITETTPDHDFSQFASDGAATHTRKCFCGHVETVKHTFTGNVCADCGLQKSVIVYDDIESITASNGFENLEILFDGLKNTTGLKAESDIEYYPTKDKDYIYITLKEEVDLAGITAWICGNKGHIKITVYGADGKEITNNKIELKGSGDYYDYKSVPVNITFFGTVAVKYIKIEAEGLAKESGLVQKISEIDLTLGTKLDLETDKPHTNIELVFDIPTLNAIGIEITPEILEKLSKADLKVESDIGQIILDAISMNKVSGISGNVTIGITDITDEKEVNSGKRVFSITVNDENGNPILPPDQSEENGTLTLSFKYKAGLKKEQIKVVYRDEEGKIQHMEVESYDPVTGIVQFKTNHLSVYEIYADGESNEGLLEGAFTFKGYSVSSNTGALSVGFSINYDIIRAYEEITGTTVDFGVVFASFEDLGGKNPLDGNGNPFELENSYVISMSLTDYGYTSYDFVIGEMTEEYFDHSFVISAYAKGVEGVWYYQDKGMCDTVDGVTYREILDLEIVE